jgi:L-rhamnose mutarotase
MEEVLEAREIREVKRYKTRLLLGEGDFSYACALVKKHLESHPGLGHAIVASAYESEDVLRQKYPQTFDQHIRYLQENSVRVLFIVDATTLHADPRFKDTTFDCIHFNFPNVPGSYNTGALSRMLGEFYRSARPLQNLKGRIYMALPRPPNQNHYDNVNKIASNVYYKITAYNIYENTRNAGYALVKKRRFGKDRYAEYQHVQTEKSNSAPVAERFPKEYIFEKTDLSSEEILAQDKRRDVKPPFDNQTRKYIIPEIRTDGDTTEYTFMDSEKPNLYPIANPLMAKEWILKLLRKQKELFEKVDKGIKPEPSDIKKFIKTLKSVEVYLSGNPKKLFYTHNSGFRWKSHIAIWYYRSILGSENTPKKSEENIELKHQFISFLLSIIKKTPCHQYTGYITNALEALFYLFEYNSERILNAVSTIIEKPGMNYKCKAVAFSILMKRCGNQAFRDERLIPHF